MRKNLRALKTTLRKDLDSELRDITNHAAERARALAPILTGDLRKRLAARVPVYRRGILEARIVDDVEYAMNMHEHQTPAEPTWYGLGPISRIQPIQQEGPVGGKFIQRVIQYHAGAYKERLQDRINRTLGSSAKN